MADAGEELVWYAAYGSNMHRERLALYVGGGIHPGGTRSYPGCRDPRPPRRTEALTLPGRLYFATRSPVWGGGRAFYDPEGAGAERTAGVAYLVTAGQFADIAAQEMQRAPGAAFDLGSVLARGRARLGPGRYETLVAAGELDGLPVLTFTAPWGQADVPGLAPSAGYLRHLGAGLMAVHGWSPARAAAYLAGRPGAREAWTADAVRGLLTSGGRDAA